MINKDFLLDFSQSINLVTGNGPIYVVDDDSEQNIIVKACYKKSQKQNELIFLNDGDDLIKTMKSVLTNHLPMPELVLLDINMPGTNGFDALKEVRNHEEFQKIPIILMYTSSDSSEDKKKAKELGANGLWTKPFDIEDYTNFFNNI